MNRSRVVFTILVTVVLLFFLLKFSDVRTIFSAFDRLTMGALIPALFLYCLMIVVRAVRVKIFFPAARLEKSVPVLGVHNFLSNTLPFRIGELSFVHYAKRVFGVGHSEGLAVLAVTRLFDALAVAVIVVVSLLATHVKSGGSPAIAAGIFLFLSIGGLLFLSSSSCARFLVWLGSSRWRAVRSIAQVSGFVRFHTSWKVFIPAMVFSLILWSVHALLAWMMMVQGLGMSVSLVDVLFVSAVVAFLSAIPVQGFAGFGTVEASWSLLLSSIGVPVSDAIAASFVLHSFFIVFGAMIGGVSWMMIRRLKSS